MERTLVLLKPDAVQRGLVGRIIARFENKGLKLVALKMLRLGRPLARKMYQAHRGKSFYGPLIDLAVSAPVVAMVVEGLEAIAVVRGLLGATVSRQAQPGTIRGEFGLSARNNLVHGSDSPASARREIGLLFAPRELLKYPLTISQWVYARELGEKD